MASLNKRVKILSPMYALFMFAISHSSSAAEESFAPLPPTPTIPWNVAFPTTVRSYPTGFTAQYFNFEDYVYSRSRKTELGDQSKFAAGLRYQYSTKTYGLLGFQTDPVDNRFTNNTSKFQLLLGHEEASLKFQVDGELRTNDGTTGGTVLGFNVSSPNSYVSWAISPSLYATFYPFNFGGDVGRTFNTWDVTRIYFIDGAPTSISPAPSGTEQVGAKTIPGVELRFARSSESFSSVAYAAVGSASYLYPGTSNFDIETSTVSDRWERREDVGYKFGALLVIPDRHRFEVKYAGHNKAAETGSLLESAGSFWTINRFGSFIAEGEVTYSKAGSRPYRLNKAGTWFDQTAPWQPVYKDRNGVRQDWVGKGDFAYAVKLGLDCETWAPYVSYKHQGPNFIFRERESAHRLRTADESQSHGGLDRIGIGAYFYEGDFVVQPSVERLTAKNAVFGNSSDIRQDQLLSSFEKEDYYVYLTVSYAFGGARKFQP